MLGNYLVSDGESKPRAGFLGSEEGVEDPVQVFLGDARALIPDRDQHSTLVFVDLYLDLAAVRHRLNPVDEQVQKHLTATC